MGTVKKRRGKQKPRCQKIKMLMDQRAKQRKELRKTNCKKKKDELLQMVRILNTHIHTREKEIEGEKRKQIIQEIGSNGGVRNGGFWQVKKKFEPEKKEPICAIKTDDGKMIKNEENMLKEYEKFYKNLLSVKTTDEKTEAQVDNVLEQIKKIGKRQACVEIQKNEVITVKKRLEKKKSSDRDGWCNEMIIYGGDDLMESLTAMMNEVNRTCETPKEWEKLKIKSLYKNKGSRHELTNRRGIFITSIVSKFYERIVLNRNDRTLDSNISESQ